MNVKLYVGNLDYGVTSDQLGEYFAQAGTVVSATVITDRYSGRSKGFGFVEMASEDEAKKAIETLNGKEFQGRTIVVNEARPPRERGPQSSMPASSAGSSQPASQPFDDSQPEDTLQPDEIAEPGTKSEPEPAE
ncbi:MAG: RNA-binding protein [Candidatus Pacebacteria bacterium]|nr:RNA-binding protein [Candidatus Paceibacterota bacterium]